MENKEYTTIEIVDITINNLCGINVPAGLTEQIGVPLAQNITNLRILKEMIEKDAEERAKEAEHVELGDIDLGEAEEAGEEKADA